MSGDNCTDVKYVSSNSKVEAVDANGKVTAKAAAKAAGTTVITAKCGSYKATCRITVKNPTIKAAASVGTLFAGGTSQIKVTKTGLTAKVTYTSSNTKVATVSSKGVVKGIKKGTAVITVSSNGITKKVKVTVK